jgi:prepilin-type processing-associated H-X9-DG protein
VVIAVIVILASLLLPALSRAKAQALSVACLNNLKQLQVCSHLYALDHADRLPPNNFRYIDVDTLQAFEGYDYNVTWCPGPARYDTTTTNIERGLLFPYNRSAALYHCPADKSKVEALDGTAVPILKTRSYQLSQSINGHMNLPARFLAAPWFETESAINDPAPPLLFAFIDVNEEEIDASSFGILPPGWARIMGKRERWTNLPAARHRQGCNLSFADGHVEHWRWAAPKIFQRVGQEIGGPEDMKDYRRLQASVRPEYRFK